MGALGIFQLVVMGMQALPALIQAAESIFGAVKGQGSVKKEYVQTSIKTGLQIAALAGNDDAAKTEVQNAILEGTSTMIDGLVGAVNAANAWGHVKATEGSDR